MLARKLAAKTIAMPLRGDVHRRIVGRRHGSRVGSRMLRAYGLSPISPEVRATDHRAILDARSPVIESQQEVYRSPNGPRYESGN